MVCLYCGGPTRVTNSRPQKRLFQTWRRRTCLRCNAVFTTNEAIDLGTSVVVQQNGRIEPFNRDMLFMSVWRAVGHRKQPILDATALTATITAKLVSNTSAMLQPEDITKIALQVLKRFDTAAAVQYKAYHQ